ncbi:hypothetical protein FRC19_009938 [Serendipita sp. 401]|nr:hypothetical protein FRC19_009938 [Serendipita sp. 401]KAG8838911.1 hypothetical protein FRC18_002139 [Serendipita sp. 400]
MSSPNASTDEERPKISLQRLKSSSSSPYSPGGLSSISSVLLRGRTFSHASKIPVLAGSARNQTNFKFYSDIGDDEQVVEEQVPLRFSDPPPTLKEIHSDGRRISQGVEGEEDELGDDAEVWEEYCKESREIDHELITELNGSLDVLLIFAGLFCAVLAALLIESYKLLEAGTDERTLLVLQNILLSVRNNSAVEIPMDRPFTPSASAVRVNTLWFSSLALALGVAVQVMLAKQWLHKYSEGLPTVPRLRMQLRQYRYDSLRAWALPEVVNFLPTLLHLALALFLLGLVDFLWEINTFVATFTLAICVLFGTMYAVFMILPHIFTDCPYKTPFSQLLGLVYYQIRIGIHSFRKDRVSPPKFVSLEQAEYQSIQVKRDILHAKALAWLMNNTRNPSIIKIVTQSLAGLTSHFTAVSVLRRAGAVQRVAEQFLSCFTENRVSNYSIGVTNQFQLNEEKGIEAGLYAKALVGLTESLPASRWPQRPPKDLHFYANVLDSALGSLSAQTDDADTVVYAVCAREHVFRAGRNRFPNNQSQAPLHNLGALLEITRKIAEDELIPGISAVVCVVDTIRRCVEATATEQRHTMWRDFSLPLIRILGDTPPDCRVREALSRTLACFGGLNPSRDYSDGNDPTEHRLIFSLSALLVITVQEGTMREADKELAGIIADSLSLVLESYSCTFVHSIRPLSETLALVFPVFESTTSTAVKRCYLEMVRHADFTDIPPHVFPRLIDILRDEDQVPIHAGLARVLERHLHRPEVAKYLSDEAILKNLALILSSPESEERVQASLLLAQVCSTGLKAGGKGAQKAAIEPLIQSGLLKALKAYFWSCSVEISSSEALLQVYGQEDSWVPRLLALLELYQAEVLESGVMDACIMLCLLIQPHESRNLQEWWGRYVEWVGTRAPKPRPKGALFRRHDA